MAQDLNLKISGLHTSVNDYSSAPEGALVEAQNIDILQPNIAEPRRGFRRFSANYVDLADRSDRIFFYQDKLFAHHGTAYSADQLSYFDGTNWQLVGSYAAPSLAKMRTVEANQNLYFTTSGGVQRLEAFNATPEPAGISKALDISLSLTGSSGFLEDDHRVVYRLLFAKRDANNNLIRGAPSGRAAITQTVAGPSTRDVIVRSTLPADATTSWFYQVFKSNQVDQAGDVVEPNDELQLCYEAFVDGTDITNGYVQFTDILPDALRGATIYTAQSQETITQQNEKPPLCRDMAYFADCLFWADTISAHRFTLTLLATGSPNGLQLDDTLVIGGVTYTAKAAEDFDVSANNAHFKVSTGGSASQDIQDTAQSLIRVINRSPHSTVNAYYLSGPGDLPGIMLLEEQGIGGAAFTVLTARNSAFNPTNLDTARPSKNDEAPNGIAWSKPFQPDSATLVNRSPVGSKASRIRRILPLRESLLILKDDGIYRLQGSYPNFNTKLLDSSAEIIGSETAVVLNNKVYCLTTQGIVAISEDVRVISRPIEEDLLALIGSSLETIKTQAFGVGYEAERKYYLFMPTGSSDSNPQFSWVHNVFTNAWTTHQYAATSAAIYKSALYYAGNNFFVKKESKTRRYADYADFEFNATITGSAGNVLTLDGGTDLINPGDIILQTDAIFSVVNATNQIASTVTVDNNPGFTNVQIEIRKAIRTYIEWVPVTYGNPAMTKSLHTAQLLFKKDFAGIATLGFKTDLSSFYEYVTIEGVPQALWGLFAWGSAPWGGQILRRDWRQWIPRAKQRCSLITMSFEHEIAYSGWQLTGVSFHGTAGSDKTRRS